MHLFYIELAKCNTGHEDWQKLEKTYIMYLICNKRVMMALDCLRGKQIYLAWWNNIYTVDSRYLDPSYLDSITYVELISKSRLFSLCFIVLQLPVCRTTFMSTLRLSRPSFSVPEYIFHSFYYRVSRTRTMTKEK